MTEVIEGLDASEIKKCILAAVSRMLDSSCDLRDGLDNYASFSVDSIEIRGLHLHGMDTTTHNFDTKIQPKIPPAPDMQSVEVNLKTDIPLEEDLTVVRENLENPPQAPEPAAEEEENRMPARLRRKYTRRTATEITPSGGAVNLDDELGQE